MITILKHRTPPPSLRFLDTLLPRLHKHYPQLDSLKKQTAILQKGYNGERKLDYHLQLLPDYFSILSDISLHHKQSSFQIDSLILSEHAIFIIDSKSIDGEITFDTKLQQLIQIHKQRVNSYKYPITQIETIKFLLMKWLQERQISGLAIFYFISIADASSILKVIGDENHIGKIVTFAENIPHFILQKNKQIEQYYKPNRQLKNKIITAIMKEHNDLNIDMIKKFNINMEHILPGVICRKCYLLKTSYHFGYWTCSNCGHKDKKGYIHGLHDYFTLFGNGISNKSARAFLELPYKSTMTRMLKRANLNYKKQIKNGITINFELIIIFFDSELFLLQRKMVSESTHKMTETIDMTNEPTHKMTEPIDMTAESTLRTSEASYTKTEATNTASEPMTTTTEPIHKFPHKKTSSIKISD